MYNFNSVRDYKNVDFIRIYKKSLSVFLAFCLSIFIFPITASADMGALYITTTITEEGGSNRDAAALMKDGLFQRRSQEDGYGGTIYNTNIDFVFQSLGGSTYIHRVNLYYDDRNNDFREGYSFSGEIQVGTYTLVSCDLPKGYDLASPVSFSISQNDYNDMQDGICEKTVDIKIKYTGSNSSYATKAIPTASSIFVDGEKVSFDAYNINGSNYFKLRDIAYILNGSAKQFDVSYDQTKNAITLIKDTAYTVVGGEMVAKSTGEKLPECSNSTVLLNGYFRDMKAYNIDGNNYFKLRDIGSIIDFGVTWDGVNNAVNIDTHTTYVPEY